MIQLNNQKGPVNFKQWRFPAGEVGVKIEDDIDPGGDYSIFSRYPSTEDIFIALNLADALKHGGVPKENIEFCAWYMPYSRQDRVCHPGESFAMDVFAKVLGSGHIGSVFTKDLHSSAGEDALCRYLPETTYVPQHLAAKDLPEFDWLMTRMAWR